MSALDKYILASLSFVIGTLAEFAVVLLLRRMLNWKHNNTISKNSLGPDQLSDNKTCSAIRKVHPISDILIADQHQTPNTDLQVPLDQPTTNLFKSMPIEDKIDMFALIVFPICYASFNYFYWNEHLK